MIRQELRRTASQLSKTHPVLIRQEIDKDGVWDMMYDFFCTEAGDMHYGILAERVRYFKRTEEGVKAMSEAMEELAKKWAEEEVQEEREAVVFRMLETGKTDLEKIAKVSKLSVEEVERLAKLQPV